MQDLRQRGVIAINSAIRADTKKPRGILGQETSRCRIFYTVYTNFDYGNGTSSYRKINIKIIIFKKSPW